MGKKFQILEINHANLFSKMCVVDINNKADKRVIHVETVGWADNIAKGIEMSDDFRVLAGAGYMLGGEKPVKDWAPNDIVEEQFYPEELDNRG